MKPPFADGTLFTCPHNDGHTALDEQSMRAHIKRAHGSEPPEAPASVLAFLASLLGESP